MGSNNVSEGASATCATATDTDEQAKQLTEPPLAVSLPWLAPFHETKKVTAQPRLCGFTRFHVKKVGVCLAHLVYHSPPGDTFHVKKTGKAPCTYLFGWCGNGTTEVAVTVRICAIENFTRWNRLYC